MLLPLLRPGMILAYFTQCSRAINGEVKEEIVMAEQFDREGNPRRYPMEREHLSVHSVVQYLDGLDLPADKSAIIRRARANGAPDDVVHLLQGLPARQYQEMDD